MRQPRRTLRKKLRDDLKRELLTPDEVMRLDTGTEILLRQGQRPALTRKVRYYQDREFAGMFGTG